MRALLPLLLPLLLVLPGAGMALGAQPRVVGLGGSAHALALAGATGTVAIATTDGVTALTASGDALFHALAGSDITAVAIDRAGDVVLAGGADGRVHFLRGDGTEFATALTVGALQGQAVLSAALPDDGSVGVVGSADGFVYAFDPAQPVPAGLPAPPADPLGLVLPQWWYNTGAPVDALIVTGDGAWVAAADEASDRFYIFNDAPALLPGNALQLGPLSFPPCQGFLVLTVKCWSVGQNGPGPLRVFANGHATYNVLLAYESGTIVAFGTSLPGLGNSWYYNPGTSASAGAMSGNGQRCLLGNNDGDVAFLDCGSFPNTFIGALWTAHLGAKVARAAASDSGGTAAAGDVNGHVAVWSTASSAPLFTYDAGGALSGLAVRGDGSGVVAAQGTSALVWT
jgi:WD40 repeat protein